MAGQLATASFDHQHPQAPDNRMQRPNLNARNEISPWIRWEGMQVYVVQEQKTYQLVGGTGNEHWQEIAAGGGASNFVGQFPTFDDLPESGSPGDYAYVGTGDDFVQYNWDQIAGEWRLNSAETKVSDEDFFLGRVPSEPDRVMFSMRRNSIIYSTGGSQSISPDRMANYVFTGENVTLENVNYDTEGNEEFHITNRTGSNLTILGTGNFASGLTIPAGHMASFKSSNDGWVQSFVNEEATFSDTLDSVNARISRGPDGLDVLSGVFDRNTGEEISFKQLGDNTYPVDGVLSVLRGGDVLRREFTGPINIKWFGATGDEGADDTDAIQSCFTALKAIRDHIRSKTGRDGLVTVYFPAGTYNYSQDIEIHDTGGVQIVGDGVTNTILNYTGTETAISIGDGVTRARYFKLSNFGIRNYNGTAETAILLNYAHEGFIENIWISGGDTGFTKFGVAIYGSQASLACWTIKLNDVRVSNISGIGYILYGGNHNAIRFTDCSATRTFVGTWLERSNGVSFVNWQSELAFSGALVRVGPYEGTAQNRALSFTNPYFETESGNPDGRILLISENDKDDIPRLCVVDGLNISGPHAQGMSSADYAIEIYNPTISSLMTGIISGGDYRNFEKALIKSESQNHKFRFEPNKKTLVDAIPFIENQASSGITVITNYHTVDFNKPVKIGDYNNNPPHSSITEGALWYSRNLKRPRYSRGGDSWATFSEIFASSTTPDEVAFPRQTGASYLRTNSRTVEMWDGYEFFDIRNRLIRNIELTGASTNFSATDHDYYLRVSGPGPTQTRNIIGGRFNEGDVFIGHCENDLGLIINGTSGASVVSAAGIGNLVPKGCRFTITMMSGTLAVLSVSNISSRPEKEISSGAYNPSSSDLPYYIRFTGVEGSSSIEDGRFEAGDELQGEIEGGAKTFVAGAGVTLRYPAGGTNVAPTNSRFFIKFKSPNDAQLTIVPGVGGSGAEAFTDLSDAPNTLIGQAFRQIQVSSDETSLVFFNPTIVNYRSTVTLNSNNAETTLNASTVPAVRVTGPGENCAVIGKDAVANLRFLIVNQKEVSLRLSHNNSSIDEENRFHFDNGEDLILPPGGWADIIYVNDRWRLQSLSPQLLQIKEVRESVTNNYSPSISGTTPFFILEDDFNWLEEYYNNGFRVIKIKVWGFVSNGDNSILTFQLFSDDTSGTAGVGIESSSSDTFCLEVDIHIRSSASSRALLKLTKTGATTESEVFQAINFSDFDRDFDENRTINIQGAFDTSSGSNSCLIRSYEINAY